MDEIGYENLYMRLFAAARTLEGLNIAFEWSAKYLMEHKDDGMDWINCNYEAVAGAVQNAALLLDELTVRLTNDELDLVIKKK